MFIKNIIKYTTEVKKTYIGMFTFIVKNYPPKQHPDLKRRRKAVGINAQKKWSKFV